MTWPPRWDKPHFKERTGPAKVKRALKRIAAKSKEDVHKAAVRKRDKRCRFPLCGCGKYNLSCEVSHKRHKGSGGNPKGDRSQPELMVYLCRARHRGNTISVDLGTLRWRPLTKDGANGPIAWDVDLRAMHGATGAPPRWIEVGRETAVGVLEPLDQYQQDLLKRIGAMTL